MGNVEIGKYYASDYKVEDETIETNVHYVVGKEGNYIQAETMYMEKGKFNCLYKNGWGIEFFKRIATENEIETFKFHRKSTPVLSHYLSVII